MDAHHKLLGGASPVVWVKVMTNQPHHPILGHLSGAELGLRDANGFDSILLFFLFCYYKPVRFYHRINAKTQTHKRK